MTAFDSMLTAAQAGAEWAWERFYRELSPPVRGYLVAHGAAEPDDLLGEVWLQVARNIGTFAGDAAGFRSWVFLVAHHRITDERRRRARRPEFPLDEAAEDSVGFTASAEDSAITSIEAQHVVRLLSQLTPEQRDVLTLRVLGDLTVAQVAHALSRRPGAVKALQRRGIRVLRKMFE